MKKIENMLGKRLFSLNFYKDLKLPLGKMSFTKDFVTEAWEGFPEFLENGIAANPEKCEYYLPSVVTRLIESGKATVKVLTSSDKWYGVTYKEDKPMVQKAMADMHESGRYPEKLWK